MWIIIDYLVTSGSNLFILQSLTAIKGLSEAKVDKICEAAEKLVVSTLLFIVISFLNDFIPIELNCSLVPFPIQNFGYITGSDCLLKVRCSFVNL